MKGLLSNPSAIAVLALSLFSFCKASCPGDTPCSGHGSCGAWDLCTCHKNWKGFDCSQRVCPFDDAWGDVKDTTISGRTEHHYVECSGKGSCNTDNGQCECYDGFEGKACQRMSCPDDCSGHGTCELMSELNSGYSAWDADKIQICKCDPGFTGIACEFRKCKPGDDPLTLHTIGGSAYQVNEVQTVTIEDTTPNAISGEFTLTYTDWRGAKWTTRPLDVTTATAISVEEALEELPNQAIPSVTVSKTGTHTGGSVSFAITFTDDATPGNQPALEVNIDGCDLDGCQPVFTATTSAGTVTATVTETTAGTEELIECSKRGECNTNTGLCECFTGYYGEACQFQTLAM